MAGAVGAKSDTSKSDIYDDDDDYECTHGACF